MEIADSTVGIYDAHRDVGLACAQVFVVHGLGGPFAVAHDRSRSGVTLQSNAEFETARAGR